MPSHTKAKKLSSLVLLILASWAPVHATTAADCEAYFSKEEWNRALQCTHDLPRNAAEYHKLRVRSAIALFEKRLPLSALIAVQELKTKDTQKLSENETRLLELAALFQKKVPAPLLPTSLEAADLSHVPSYLEDEVRYAKARFALSKGDFKSAVTHFASVGGNSRYFPLANYHLGAIALREKNVVLAEKYFIKLYQSQVMTQPSEVWQQMMTQFTLHWGPSFHVALDAERILKSQELGDLGLLAFARLSYAKKDFGRALQHYEKVPPPSRYRSTAALERIWTLIQLNRQGEAQAAASDLAKDAISFESFKAEPLVALILIESQKTNEARNVLASFDSRIAELKDELQTFLGAPRTAKMPPSLGNELKSNELLETLNRFEADLDKELADLNADDMRPYTAFQTLALKLSSWKKFALEERVKLQVTIAKTQLAAIPAIERQSKLMLAETYLEDREILRREFVERSDHQNPEVQKSHDQRLAALIEKVLQLIETSFPNPKQRPASLEFRQVELLWELASAKMILAQTDRKETLMAEAQVLRKQAVTTMSRLLSENANPKKRADALFFKGFAELELQRDAEGHRTLKTFVTDYPEHEHAPDAFRILGDQAFDTGHFDEAASYFRKIIAFGDSPIVGYAFYKAGWSWYYLRDYTKALHHLELAIRWAEVVGFQTSTFNLTRESKRDYIAIFAENGKVEDAFAQFDRVFRAENRTVALWDLGKELDRNGQFENASRVYGKIYGESSSANEKLALQSHLLYDYYRLRRWAEIEQEIIASPGEGKYYTSDNKDEVETRLREIAMGQHFEFQKDNTLLNGTRMEKVDRFYLKLFGQEPNSQPVRYELGLLLLNRGNFDGAVDELKQHWALHKDRIKEPLKEQALRNLLFSLEKKEAKGAPATSVSPEGEMLLSLSAEYASLYPKSANARLVSSLRPSIFYKYGKLESGMQESELLLAENAGDKVGTKAFRDLRVAHLQNKDWARTVAWCDAKLINETMAPLKKDFISLHGEALFFWAEALGEKAAAAEKFELLASDPRHSNLRDKAAFRAFAIYEKQNQKKDAARLLEKYLGQARPAPELNSWTSLGAVLYQEAGDFESAGRLWKKYLTLPGSANEKDLYLQAKWNRGRITFAEGNRKEAMALMTELLAEAKGNTSQHQQIATWLDKQHPSKKREPTALPHWNMLVEARNKFEKSPLPKAKGAANRISEGGKVLAGLVKEFVDFSKSQEASQYHRVESACSLPLLYNVFAAQVTRLGKELGEKATNHLLKISQPVEQKAKELAKTCIDEGEIALHSGPAFNLIRGQFAPIPLRDAEKWAGLLERLNDPRLLLGSPPQVSEKEVLASHIEGKTSPDSWQNLTTARFLNKNYGLAELTAEEAVRRYPKLGLPYGVMGYAAFSRGASEEAMSLFEKATELGWPQAQLGSVLFYGRQRRYGLARSALKRSLASGAFAGFGETESLARELVKE